MKNYYARSYYLSIMAKNKHIPEYTKLTAQVFGTREGKILCACAMVLTNGKYL